MSENPPPTPPTPPGMPPPGSPGMPPPGSPGMPPGGAGAPSFAEENAMRVAAESLTHYDQENDTYHVSYGPVIPAVTVRDTERGLLVRVDPASELVVGFSIPNFKEWHREHADPDGGFEVDLPPTWSLRPGGSQPDENRDDEDEDE